MPHTIRLQKFSEDFSNATNISYHKLAAIISGAAGFKIEDDDAVQTLFVWQEEKEEWFPLLWLTDEKSYINSNPVFELGLYYYLVKIAEKLHATIITEEGLVLFTPAYGLLLDPDEGIDESVSLHELQTAIIETGNILSAINTIKATPKNTQQIVTGKTGKSKMETLLQSKKASVLAIILVIIFCIIMFLTMKK